ncbi:MAG: hypothetical protein R2695_20560 [Acidimicrobiales bacterium]
MTNARSPFLEGALAWISGDEEVATCSVCGWDWSIAVDDALAAIRPAPDRYRALLTDRDGMVPARDGGWNATAYVWHLTDLARSWTERWVQIAADPGSLLAGWDPDVLAAARNYRALPTEPALWALRDAVSSFVDWCDRIDHGTAFEHGDWGPGTVADGIRWLGHELVHHQIDVAERSEPI